MSMLDEALDAIRRGAPADTVESTRLEFKQEAPSVKETLASLSDAVVCLANADGGWVVAGVLDRPGEQGSIVGVSDKLTAATVVNGVFERTRPPLSVPVEEHREASGARLLVITVPRGATFYSNARGTATRRVGTACQPFTPEQQRQALAARGQRDWSAEHSGLNTTIVDAGEMARARRLLVAAGRPDVAALDDTQMLRDLRLSTGDGLLTNAGALLLTASPDLASTIPTYGFSYQFRATPGTESVARFRGTRPLLAAVEMIIDAVETRRSVHPLNIGSGVQLQLFDYPTQAVRELVVNGLVHRDYEVEGSVDVDHSPDRLTISSPGGLVFGVTPENILTHPSTPRNRLLMDVVTGLQVAERHGQGVDRAYRETLRAGKPPPNFTDDESRVTVLLTGGLGNDSFVRYVTTMLDDAVNSDLDVLLALDLLCRQKSIGASTLAPVIQRTPTEAQSALDRMARAGLLDPSKRTARHAFPTYALTPSVLTGLGRAVSYRRRTRQGTDLKVVEHVVEYGTITNQTLRRIFDINVYQARDLLRDLQDRAILVKIDDKTAGPGVRYGAGPKFPKGKARPTPNMTVVDEREGLWPL